MNVLINLLSNNGYIILNKGIMKKFGLHEAIILGELCSEYSFWEKSNKLEDGYFYSTRENLEDNTLLTAYQQRLALQHLIDGGIVIVRNKGMPLQKWYSFDTNRLYKILNENEEFVIKENDFTKALEKIAKNSMKSSSQISLQQDVKKFDIKESNNLTSSSQNTLQQDVKKIDDKVSNNLTTSSKEILQHDVKKFDINNNNNNNNNNNKNIVYNYNKKLKYLDRVFLYKKEYDDLINKYGKEKIHSLITKLDLYKKSTGKQYKDDYATILLWIKADEDKQKEKCESEDSEWMKHAKELYGPDMKGLCKNYDFLE